jgi:hypothetical protein
MKAAIALAVRLAAREPAIPGVSGASAPAK